ncbi:MAG: hypothetical protein DRJ42_17300 [Deltaproteobacteria bacterium]|nr:MAG: hypothetical protein DRJ42_17300 [Deltaproteobacteria bacterium]
MNDATKTQLAYEDFAARFVRPLLTGEGPTVVGRPLTPGMLDHFAVASSSDSETDRVIYDFLHGSASELTPVRALHWPERGSVALAMAAHDLIAVTDPKLDRAFARGARDDVLEYVDWLIDAAGAPATRGEALCRHALIGRFLSLSRADVVVKNWAYTYRFFGRPVPPRVVAMPKVRMVRQEKTEPSLLDVFQGLEADLPLRRRLRELVRRSPVTQMLRTDLFGAPNIGQAALAVLSDDVLRGGIARRLVRDGAAVMKPFGEALEALYQGRPPPQLLFYLIALIYEVHVVAILGARAGQRSPFGVATDPGAKLFAAILPALLGAPDDLESFLDLDPDDLTAVRKAAGTMDGVAGNDAVRHAVAIIDYAEPPNASRDHTPTSTEFTEVHP